MGYEAGYKLHNNTMTYDKLINSPFVHDDQLSKKCVIFRLMPNTSNVLRIITAKIIERELMFLKQCTISYILIPIQYKK